MSEFVPWLSSINGGNIHKGKNIPILGKINTDSPRIESLKPVFFLCHSSYKSENNGKHFFCKAINIGGKKLEGSF